MDFKPIIKHALTGGMVISMINMIFTPLSEMVLPDTLFNPPVLTYAAEREIHPFQQTK